VSFQKNMKKEKFDHWIEEKYEWNSKRNFKIMQRKMEKELKEERPITPKNNKERMNRTCDNINIEPIYLRLYNNNIHNLKPNRVKNHYVNYSPFVSRKCPQFNKNVKSNRDSLDSNRDCASTQFNTFRNAKSSKRKEDLNLTQKCSSKTEKSGKTTNRKFSLLSAEEEGRYTSRCWQDSIHFLGSHRGEIDDFDLTYKINVRNSSAWDNNRENNVYYTSRCKKIINNLIQ